ncbi:hypothetical protein RJ639_019810 [Escallonia herrerae]|uniref:Golgi to ER traffic protein 4 homolog n=1 Tax=Escallonia herrerae TaxID=1293975 RepID=A0AA89AJF4_9ASTE|nr:hypothetical protein RJ639_019810 [Escallonia herrerae]
MSRERSKKAALPPAKENIAKLEKVVKEGNSYGAQQMYKSITARYVSAERYSEALDILQAGSCIQLEHKQVTCGAELAVLFVDTLVKGNFRYDDEILGINSEIRTFVFLLDRDKIPFLDRIRRIYKRFPQTPVPQHLDLADDGDMQQLSETIAAAKTHLEGCSSFLKAAIKWSAEFGAHKSGSPEIHDMLAEYIYLESPEVDIARASLHFVRGKNPKKFASILVNFLGKCYPGEEDLAIARAILLYLSLGNLRDANYVMDEVKKQAESKGICFPQSDLIQFIKYLLQMLQRDALPLFNILRQNYRGCVEREPAFNELLDKVAEKFYGVRRQSPLQGVFGDFFKMMGGE